MAPSKKKKLKDAIKKKDGWWATLFSGKAANFLLRFIADEEWITPNCVTTSSLFICILACAFISVGTHLYLAIGGILLQLVFVVDCLDGQLARYRNQCSNFGAWYDRVTDRLKDFLIYFSIALGYFNLHENWRIWPLTMIAFFFVFLFDYYVNMDVKLESAVCETTKKSKKKSTVKKFLSFVFALGEKVYKGIPVLQFHIGEQYLILTTFLVFNRSMELMLFVVSLGMFYSVYWPVSKYFGRKPSS